MLRLLQRPLLLLLLLLLVLHRRRVVTLGDDRRVAIGVVLRVLARRIARVDLHRRSRARIRQALRITARHGGERDVLRGRHSVERLCGGDFLAALNDGPLRFGRVRVRV